MPQTIRRALGRMNVDAEGTIPTWYASLVLLLAAILLLLLALAEPRRAHSTPTGAAGTDATA